MIFSLRPKMIVLPMLTLKNVYKMGVFILY